MFIYRFIGLSISLCSSLPHKVQKPLCLLHETTLQRPKVLRTCGFFFFELGNLLCATALRFFNISTSKSAPKRLHFKMFTSKCATMAYTFSIFFDISISKVLWSCGVFSSLTSKSSKGAACHSSVQFLNSYLPRWLRTRRFSKPTCRPLKH